VKIAITADLHLTNQETNPDRFQALADILQQCNSEKVEILIIAGDLFDKEMRNFADFESVYREHASDSLSTYVIPGNHDVGLLASAITVGQVHVINETTLLDLDQKLGFLFVPYLDGITMGEEIAQHKEKLQPNQWVLVGHGDWVGGVRSPDPYESGIYMPITNADIINYKPIKAFLGHIHLPSDGNVIHYVGSPCPVKISETGRRRFIVFNTESQLVQQFFVNCPQIYFIEDFLLYPIDDEAAYLRECIRERIEGWNLPEQLNQNIVVRVSLSGYTSNRVKIAEIVKEEFAAFQFYDDEGPLLADLEQKVDPDRAYLAQEVKKWIEKDLRWTYSNFEPNKDEIMVEALKIIYGA
jgi:DNA repair protein SbcD/Mre11